MIRTTALIGLGLLIFDSAAFAQSGEPSDSFEACFRQGRLADGFCEGADQQTKLDCYKKNRANELACLKHILPGEPTASTPPPGSPATSSTEPPYKPPERTGSTEQTPLPKVSSPDSSPSKTDTRPNAPKTPPASGATTAHIPPNIEVEKGAEPSANRWVVSETVSPIDYSPLVTAALEPTQPGQSGPINLKIRCRAKRIEFSLQFSPNPAPRNGTRLYLQIEGQLSTLPVWSWTPDGRIATLKNDPMPLLQTLPEGSTLRIWTGDRARESSVFQLAGLDAVRRKVTLACNAAPPQARTPLRKRKTGGSTQLDYGRR